MAKTIQLFGATYSDVPAVDLPTPSGTARFLDEGEVVTYHVSANAPTSSDGEDGDVWLVTS